MCFLWYIWLLNYDNSRHFLLCITQLFIPFFWTILPMIKGDTLWQLIYCDKIWYILWLYRDLSRHTVYENQQILIQFFCTILTVKKADAYVSLFTLLMHCTIFLWKVKEGDTLCYIFHKYWISYVTLFDKWK